MRHVTKAFTVLGLALVAWLLVVVIGRSAALDAANRTIADQKEANAAKVEAAIRVQRDSLAQERAERIQVERDLYRERQKSMHILDSANMATISNMAVLQDSAATVPQLRGALYVQVQTTERVVAEFHEYLRSDSLAHQAFESERTVLYRSLTLADSTIAAKNEAIRALRKVGECRIVGPIRCPTRTQAFVGGALVTLGVIFAVR